MLITFQMKPQFKNNQMVICTMQVLMISNKNFLKFMEFNYDFSRFYNYLSLSQFMKLLFTPTYFGK